MAKKAEAKIVEIKPIQTDSIPIRIVGDSPLICHAWSSKARKMILTTQMRETKTKAKETRNPMAEFINNRGGGNPLFLKGGRSRLCL